MGRLGGSIFGDSGYNSFRLGFSSLTEDFERVLQLTTEILAVPSFPEDGIEREKASQIPAIEADEAQSGVITRNVFRSAVYGGQPYAANPTGPNESVATIQRTDL